MSTLEISAVKRGSGARGIGGSGPVLTLPKRYYTEPAIFEREKERIFSRCWQYAGHISQLPAAGSYITRKHLDESLFFIRDEAGEIRGFYNVCQHRAHQLLEGSGCAQSIVCPYHAWRYSLDGSLQHARNSERVADFDRASIRLQPIKVERFVDFIMFNYDLEAPSFDSEVPGLADEIRTLTPRLSELVPDEKVTGFTNDTLACNWKVLVDNCIECYHCTPAHPAFADMIDIGSYRITPHAMHTSHRALPRSPDNAAYAYSLEENGECFAFWHVWPNMTFGRLPGSPNFGVFSIDPVSVGETRARGDRFTSRGPESPEETARRLYVDNVLWPEDKRICESVQRGLHSRGYEQGRLIAPEPYDGNNEIVCQLFQRLTREALGKL